MSIIDSAPVRLLVLGAGAVVTQYYLPALRELGWQSNALIVDPSADALRHAHAAAPEVALAQLEFSAALTDASRNGSFDACVVALPNALHTEATRLALERGFHVLCEKPLALSAEACRLLAEKAHGTNRIVSVGMVRRHLPSFRQLREAIRQQLIGELTGIDVEDGEPYAWTSDSGAAFHKDNGGVLADMGVHYLDLIEEILGEMTPVCYSDDCRGGVEANVDFILRTTAGLPVHMQLSRTRRLGNVFACRGERGELVVEKDRFDGCVWRDYQTRCVTRLVPNAERSATLEACFAHQLREFATCVKLQRAPVVSAGRTASTISLIEWAYQSRDRARRASAGVEASTRPLATDAFRDTRLPTGRVCVTGGTGFIGTHLVERLGANPRYEIVAPVRSYRTCAQIARFPVAMPRINLLDYESVRTAVSEARFVFHLAYGRDGPQPERVTIEGTRNVVEAAIQAGCEAVVVLSTIYVFGQPAAEVDETWPYRPIGGMYGTSKALMERWCLERAQSSERTRIVVLCPSCVYGAGGDTYSALPLRLARRGGFCWIDRGRGTANYTYVENLVDALLIGAASTQAHARRFIINDGTTTWRQFLTELLGPSAEGMRSYSRRQLRELHRRRRRPSLVDVARIAMADQGVRTALRETRLGEAVLWSAEHAAPGVMARLRRGWHAVAPRDALQVTGTSAEPNVIPPLWLADLFGPSETVFSSEQARRVLGWTPGMSLGEGMQPTRVWADANA